MLGFRLPERAWLASQTYFKFGSLLLICAVGVAVFTFAQVQTAETPPVKSQRDEFVGSSACAQCHKNIFTSYSETGMGRSMFRVTPDLVKNLRLPGWAEDARDNLHLETYAHDGKLFQTEFGIAADGKEIFRDTRELLWIVGAGENGFGTIGIRDDYLFQGPLSFYSKPQRWELSPGYEFGNYGFNRPILPACISCHSGRPNYVSDGNGRFEKGAFSELAIGCENCHGPGLRHTLAMQTGVFNSKGGHDPTIVNPATLSPRLADNICMSCHQTGDVRVLNPGKDFKDFLPGMPLDNILSIFMVPPRRESPPDSDLLEHYYSMTLSKCYRASGEKLSCITCHDPHVEPNRQEAPVYFKAKCMTCHEEKSCTLPIETRLKQSPADDCAGCHMPRRDVQEISHSSITNHRILIRPGQALPDEAFRPKTVGSPGLVHLNSMPGSSPSLPLTLLQAYGELLEKHPEYADSYTAVLDQLERTSSGDPLVESALGTRDLRAGKYENAVSHLTRALKTGPPKTILHTALAEALLKLDRGPEALVELRKAADIDPLNSLVQRTLILRLIQSKMYADAQAAMERYVDRFPEDSFMRDMLARARSVETPN